MSGERKIELQEKMGGEKLVSGRKRRGGGEN